MSFVIRGGKLTASKNRDANHSDLQRGEPPDNSYSYTLA